MRKDSALEVRIDAADLAFKRTHPQHKDNGEEAELGGYFPETVPALDPDGCNRLEIEGLEKHVPYLTFSKGLKHDPSTGLAEPGQTILLRAAINSGLVEPFNSIGIAIKDGTGALFFGQPGAAPIANIPNLPEDRQHRRWEAPTAGFVYDLQGPDAQAVTMPPAPRTLQTSNMSGPSDELVAEMAEVYWLALARDVPFTEFMTGVANPMYKVLDDAVTHLQSLPFYQSCGGGCGVVPGCSDMVRSARPQSANLNRGNVFRGQTPGDQLGPYLSQFMLIGNTHLGRPGDSVRDPADGLLQYGSISIDQRVRAAIPGLDYMTVWNEWLDVQNGANVSRTQEYKTSSNKPTFKFIETPRDLATYVHFDALYEAYLNACLWLLNVRAPVDPNFARLAGEREGAVEGFALFGGPHILSLVTEVATRALKAVRYQKFNIHLRLRPEALAGLIAANNTGVAPLRSALGEDLLGEVSAHNRKVNGQNKRNLVAYLASQSGIAANDDLPLLPMAFPEGSPMHPTYGAGHATVAGACVTILKAFFDENAVLAKDKDGDLKACPAAAAAANGLLPFAFVASSGGATLTDIANTAPYNNTFLTVGHELNKLASNISIGRNMAGVHYYSDYIQSLIMGEEIACGILEEQAKTYRDTDNFVLSFESFTGQRVIIGAEGGKTVIPT